MSLFGYFWLLNSLNFLDGFITVLGIEMDVFYEGNPVVVFFLDNFGLNSGMVILKAGVLILTAVMFKLHVSGTNVIRNAYIGLILLYSAGIAHMTWTICWAANV